MLGAKSFYYGQNIDKGL